MRYLADLLTFSRLILAFVLIILALIGGPPEAAFIIFIVAELTDAFDGTCARKWPFPKDNIPEYRKYAAKFDMFSDVCLSGAQVLFMTLQVNTIVGAMIIIYYLVSAIGGDMLVYGKVLGHPDDCTKYSLAHRDFPLARKIILTRRYVYATCLGVVNAVILFATSWPDTVKTVLFIFGCAIFVFVWFFLRQRRQHISRDAVDIEEELTQKSHKSKRQ